MTMRGLQATVRSHLAMTPRLNQQAVCLARQQPCQTSRGSFTAA
jgi:hypothetical protein